MTLVPNPVAGLKGKYVLEYSLFNLYAFFHARLPIPAPG
jgi:hypothetical protein